MRKSRLFSDRYYNLFILLYVFQQLLLIIFINNNYMRKNAIFPSQNGETLDIVIGIIILIINILAILIIHQLLLNNQFAHEKKMSQLKLKHILRENKIYRQNKHDLKNHLNVIYQLAKDGELNKLNDYVSLYIDRLDSAVFNIDVGIKELDVVIYSKIANARSLGIAVKFKCLTFLRCNNDYVLDLVSIMSNLLDNALEACSQLENNKHIEIIIREDPIDYMIEIKNTFKNSDGFYVQEIFEEGYSTKAKTRGEGLSIVQKTLKKLNGDINVCVKNNSFLVELEIPKYILED